MICGRRHRLHVVQTTNLASLYGLEAIEWERITRRLDDDLPQAPGTGGPDRHTCWLATIGADGSPHQHGIGAQWHRGSFWFETGSTTVKGRNLARDPRCTLAVATAEFDLVVRGTAHRVLDPDAVAELAGVWRDGGWPAEVDESGVALTASYSAPSAGPPPWHVYRLHATGATALATSEPGGATSWTF
jgi:hypothetical protein